MRHSLWALRTVFIDGTNEREGNNIEANVQWLIDGYQSPLSVQAHSDGLHNAYTQLVQQLRRKIETAQREEETGEVAVARSQSKSRLVRKRSGAALSQQRIPLHPTDEGVVQRVPTATSSSPVPIRDLLYGADSLSKILPNASQSPKKESGVRCPHCKLPSDAPKFYNVPLTDGGRLQRNRVGGLLHYGNLPLGITCSSLALPQLWLALAKLQLPSYADLTTEQCAHGLRQYVLSTIGVPPWMESLIASEREHQNRVDALRANVDLLKDRNLEITNEIKRNQRSLHFTKAIKESMNQEDEREALLGQLQLIKLEIADRSWQVKETSRKNERDKQSIELQIALASLRTEEIQRLLASIGMMHEILEATDPDGLKSLNTHETLKDILGGTPSTEFGRSCRRAAVSTRTTAATRALRSTQCNDCLLLRCSSPYCGVTGLSHASEEVKAPPKVMRTQSVAHKERIEPQVQERKPSASTLADDSSERSSSAEEEEESEDITGDTTTNSTPDCSAKTSLKIASRRRGHAQGARLPRKHKKAHRDDVDPAEPVVPRKAVEPPPTKVVVTPLNDVANADGDPLVATKEIFYLCAQQTEQFLEAAVRSDLTAMRQALDVVDAATGTTSELLSRYPVTAAALFDLEERFMEWFYAVNLDPAPQYVPATPQSNVVSSVDLDVSATTRVVRLKKELRELQYAFAKRPNARNQGVNLDEDAYFSIAHHMQELERRAAQMRLRQRETAKLTTSTSLGVSKQSEGSGDIPPASDVPHVKGQLSESSTPPATPQHPRTPTTTTSPQKTAPRALRFEFGVNAMLST